MRAVFTFTLVIAVLISAFLGCLMIFEVFTVAEGFECLLRALAAILLLGVSAAVISLVSANKVPTGKF